MAGHQHCCHIWLQFQWAHLWYYAYRCSSDITIKHGMEQSIGYLMFALLNFFPKVKLLLRSHSGHRRMFTACGQWTLLAPAPPFIIFLYLPFLLFSLSVRAPFSSGAPGHCPPMPPTPYATEEQAEICFIWKRMV